MNHRRNFGIWLGFLVVLAALFSYPTVFARFPDTRDHPWPTLLLFGAGLGLTLTGLRRAWRQPQVYRGRIAGAILLSLGAGVCAFFLAGFYYFARLLPASAGAPRVGQKAPDFTLPDKDGSPVTLSRLIGAGADGGASGVLLVFYRGNW